VSRDVIVTGGLGFIGSNLVRALAERGDSVYLVEDFDLLTPKKIANFTGHPNIKDVLNAKEARGLGKLFSDKTVRDVVHLGAISETVSDLTPTQILWTNLEFSKLLQEASKNTTKKFIYASSASVYGKGLHGFTEDAPTTPKSVYAFSKAALESAMNEFFTYGLRLFNVYGPNEFHKAQPSVVSKIIKNYLTGGKDPITYFSMSDLLGIPKELEVEQEPSRDFVYVGDVVDVILHFLDTTNPPPPRGIYNVGSGVSRTFKDMIDITQKELNTNYPVTSGSNSFEDDFIEQYQFHTKADLTKLHNVAGYSKEFTSLEEGIAKTVAYYRIH